MSSALAVLAIAATGLAPSVSADDVQSKQWYLSAMQAEQMWKVSTGKGIKIAVLDTGVNPDTPSLKGQVLADETPAAVSYKATEDYQGHGTTMAELIAGTGAGGGLKGLAPGSRIVPYRISLSTLQGKAEIQKTAGSAEAIRAAADTDAKIISMSFGGDIAYEDEQAAVKYAASKGKLVIAGVGNDGEKKNFIAYPAAYPFAVGVAAIDKSGKAADYSQHGNYVDLAAPGLNLPRWCDTTFTSYCDDGGGTSSATALASASAALIWSAHPGWNANQVLRVLIDTASRKWAKDEPSTYLGYGLIRPRKVLADSGIDAGPADVDPLAAENGVDSGSGGPDAASPSASVPGSSQPPQKTSGGETAAAGSTADPSDSDGRLGWLLGAAAAVVVIGGGAFAFLRKRRSG